MMKTLAALIAVLPIAAFAQGAGPGPGHDCENCRRGGGPRSDDQVERMEKRGRLARNLGLAEALDLDTAQANKLADALAKNDEKRVVLHTQVRDARQLLRKAAQGEKVSAAEVDAALAKVTDVRAQLNALDKEALAIVTKDLSPEKKARAALFLARFEQKMGPGMGGKGKGRGMGGGHGQGMGPGMGHGPGCKDCPMGAE